MTHWDTGARFAESLTHTTTGSGTVKVVDARVHSAGPGLGGAMAVLVIFPMIHVAIRTAVKRALPI